LSGLPDPRHAPALAGEDARITRPGLAPYVSPQTKRTYVALACDDYEKDGYFRLWQPGNGLPWGQQGDGAFNTTAAYWPEEGRLLTAGVREDRAHLRAWSVDPDRGPQPDARRSLSLNSYDYPRALALFSGQGDGRRDHAAVLLRAPTADNTCSLVIV